MAREKAFVLVTGIYRVDDITLISPELHLVTISCQQIT
jgi:hypothetical protein